MSYTIVVVLIAVVLFACAYISRRRFGVLVLALIAGEVLSRLWTDQVTPYIASLGFVLVKPPLTSVVAFGLILAPAIILLFSGPSTKRHHERLIGAAIFMIMVIVLAFDYISDALVIDTYGETIKSYISSYRPMILTVGIIVSVLDILAIHTRRTHTDHAGHKK